MAKWEEKRLGDICRIGDGAHASIKRLDKGIMYITAKNVTQNGLEIANIDYISEESYEKHFKNSSKALTTPMENDILYSIIGSIGGCYIVGKEKIGISSSIALLRCNTENIIPNYLLYFMKSSHFKKNMELIKSGVAQGFMSLSKLSSVKISLPDLPTQKRIADILSAYDDLIENNNRRIALLEKAAQDLYKEWFVRFRFPGYEKTTFVNGIPEGWEVKRLGEVANITMGQSPKSEFYNEEGIGLPFHQGVSNFNKRFPTHKIFSTEQKRLASYGDILLSVRAPVGKLNIANQSLVIGRGLCAINHQRNYNSFLFYQLQKFFEKLDIIGNGSIFNSVTKDELYNIKCICPAEKLQDKFEEIVKLMDQKLNLIEEQNQNLKKQRDLLLPRLMSGKLEVEEDEKVV